MTNINHQHVVWDLPIRVFHWSLVTVLAGLWYTGVNADLTRHFLLGKIMLGLLVFRFLWGFVGSHTAKLYKMPLHPKSAINYLKGKHTEYPGHNPLGSWSVLTILGLLTVQVLTGLYANDGILDEGPLAQFVSTSFSDEMAALHLTSFNALLGVLALHIAAVVFHQFIKKEKLINAMLHGKKILPVKAEIPTMAHPLIALVCIGLSIAVAYFVHSL